MESTSAPPSEQLSLPGGSLRFSRLGRGGPQLLGLHGLPGSIWDLRHLQAVMAPWAEVLLFDQPGQGESPRALCSALSLSERATWIWEHLQPLLREEVFLMGHSLGGALAMEMACQQPARVAGVILLAPVGLRPHRALRRFPLETIAGLRKVPPLRPGLSWILLRAFQRLGFSRHLQIGEIEHSLDCVRRIPWEAWARRAPTLSAPCFLSWALDDAIVEPAIVEELSASLPPGPRHIFSRGGHQLHRDHADTLGDAIRAWVSERERSGEQGSAASGSEDILGPAGQETLSRGDDPGDHL